MKYLKIGITIALQSGQDSIWSNGVRLNTLIMARLLQQSSQNYRVHLLNVFTPTDSLDTRFLRGIELHPFQEKFCEMDLLILMGSTVGDANLRRFKASGPDKKVVSYHCGNDYIQLAQSILFQDSAAKPYSVETLRDEIWYVPQQHETNCGFFHTLYRANVLIVPFVWDDYFLRIAQEDIENGYKAGLFKRPAGYQPAERKTLGIMEPNLDVVKFGLIPLMIAEQSYRGEIGRRHIERVILTNALKLKTHRQFLDIIQTFDLLRDKKISAEVRYPVTFLLTQYIDALLCHQLLNPLNYLYLDAAYLGRPVLHNAPLVRDLGYYYEGSDTRAAAVQLDRILTEHDRNLEEYHARTQAVLRRYSAQNPDLIATYDRLIERLFNGGNKDPHYNPATNLYDDA